MKSFITFIKDMKKNKYVRFAAWTAIFYCMILAIYLYLMYANLSTAPKFVYNMF